jgi:hypothetical protein
MIAVGAMSKTLRDTRAGGEGIRSLLRKNPNYIYALIEYGKDLRCMREAINKERREMRNAFFAYFLVFYFEKCPGSQEQPLPTRIDGPSGFDHQGGG